MPKIRANGLDFHYWRSGRGDDLVMIHGLGGNLAGWHLSMVPDLHRDWRVTTYDLRGHGRTGAPANGYSTRDMAEDLRRIMDVLGIERAHIVGHSWGVDIALHFALVHPERAADLVLIEGALLAPLVETYMNHGWHGWPYINEAIERLSGKPVPEQRRRDLEYLLEQLVEIPVMYGPAQGRRRDEKVVSRVAEILRPMWRGRHERQELSPETLARIRHRSLLIYEVDSVFLAAHEVLLRRLPDCREKILPGSKLKHFSGLEHPELILQYTREFLEGRSTGLRARGEQVAP